MMKKTLGLVALIVLIVLSCFYFFIQQPKNIFDEIYQETEKTYRSNNILRNIDGFKIRRRLRELPNHIDRVHFFDGDVFESTTS